MTLVIGELENRAKPVPVAFSSENLDIRHRLPDHRSRIGTVPVGTNRLASGFPRPRALRLRSKRHHRGGGGDLSPLLK